MLTLVGRRWEGIVNWVVANIPSIYLRFVLNAILICYSQILWLCHILVATCELKAGLLSRSESIVQEVHRANKQKTSSRCCMLLNLRHHRLKDTHDTHTHTHTHTSSTEMECLWNRTWQWDGRPRSGSTESFVKCKEERASISRIWPLDTHTDTLLHYYARGSV
jgi:hypothetical protein